MKAWTVTKYGKNFKVIECREIEIPGPAAGQLRIRVEAVAFNPVDLAIQQGLMRFVVPYKPPFIMGEDLSGVVDALGDGVEGFEIGDRVFAYTGTDCPGAFCHYALVDARRVARAPSKSNSAESASLPLAGLTALQALRACNIAALDKILIHGAAGSVGNIALQLAVHYGAKVYVTARSSDAAWLKGLGAEKVIDYRHQKFEFLVDEMDCVIDTVGGSVLRRSFDCLREGGTIVSLALPPDAHTLVATGYKAPALVAFMLPLISMSARRKAARCKATLIRHSVQPLAADLATLADLFDAGIVGARIDKVFTEDNFEEAYHHFESGKARGKVVVQFL